MVHTHINHDIIIGGHKSNLELLVKTRSNTLSNNKMRCAHIGFPVVNDPLYNHEVFGPLKGRGGDIGGKTDEQLVRDLINIHNAENWLGIDGDSELSLFKTLKADSDDGLGSLTGKGKISLFKKYQKNDVSSSIEKSCCYFFFLSKPMTSLALFFSKLVCNSIPFDIWKCNWIRIS